MKALLFLLSCLTAFAGAPFGTPPAKMFDYYLDSVNGNDANSGKRPDIALASIQALPALTHGQWVGLSRGSQFRGQIVFAVPDVTLASYGGGARPIIDGSTNIANASFALSGGATYVYEVAVSNNGDGTPFPEIWENGNILTETNSIANCDGTAGTYYHSGASGAVTYYVHASDNSNVTSNGKVYEHNYWGTPTNNGNQDRCQYVGIYARKSLDIGAPLYNGGYYGLIKDCQSSGGHVHNVFIGPGGSVLSTLSTELYYATTGGSHFVAYGDDAANKDVTFQDCTASQSINPSLVGGFFGHAGGSTGYGTIYFTRCYCTNVISPFSWPTPCATGISDGCVASNCLGSAFLGSSTNATIRNGHFDFTGRFFVPVDSLSVSNVTGIGDAALTDMPIYAILVNNASITVTDSSFSNGQYFLNDGVSGLNATLLRNTYNGFSTAFYAMCNASYTLTSDYNNFASGNMFMRLGGGCTFTSLADYKTTTGQDSHSTP